MVTVFVLKQNPSLPEKKNPKILNLKEKKKVLNESENVLLYMFFYSIFSCEGWNVFPNTSFVSVLSHSNDHW